VKTRAQRDAIADEIAKTFPLDQHAEIAVDEVGMIQRIALTRVVSEAKGGDVLLEIVRAHSAAFGVLPSDQLEAHLREGPIKNQWVISAGDQWTGWIMLTRDMNAHDSIEVEGHLWPVPTPTPPKVASDRVLAPFIGIEGTAPSRCRCKEYDRVVSDATSFDLRIGVALVCQDGALVPREGVAVAAERTRFQYPELAKRPTLFDAKTLEPIDADYLMPPPGQAGALPERWDTLEDRRHHCLAR
jgi:hypothetical protein